MSAFERQPSDRHLWNHEIHNRWASEELTFWRLAFFPKYDSQAIVDRLCRLMATMNVHSYGIYETLGLYDLFIRAWLPLNQISRIQDALTEDLSGELLQLCDHFTVSKILLHWAWADGNGSLRVPEETILATRWPDDQISRINLGTTTEAERSELADQNILCQLEPSEGIKFLIVVTSSVYSLMSKSRGRLATQLLKILQNHEIEEMSLYEGSGFGQFILLGRVAAERFFEIPKLAASINNHEWIQDTARPYTFLSSHEQLVYFRDRIPSSGDPHTEVPNIEALLQRGEGQEIEVKGSARLDWHRYLAGSGQPIPSDDVLNEGMIKAIVGMLNADGGYVVVGALEGSRRIGEHLLRDHPLLAEYEQVGDYVCVGVNREYQSRDWDRFRLSLLQTIESRVDPPPGRLISLTRQCVGAVDLCIIKIEHTSTDWYYSSLGDGIPAKFYVREDGRTVAYAGSRADAYKRGNPRA